MSQTGATRVQDNTVASNIAGGIFIYNNYGPVLVGSADLTQNAGNIVSGNGGYGIQVYGAVVVAGNVVSGQAAYGTAGIYVHNGSSAINNVVFNNYNGIVTDYGAPMTGNRVYHNTSIGLYTNYSNAVGNVVYSNGIGIIVSGGTLQNNLVYANSSQGIEVYGSTLLLNDTVYQTSGDAVYVGASVNNLQLRNNILWTTSGYDLEVPSSSQNGFVSDFNLLYVTGTGQVGSWQGSAKATLQAWQTATLGDGNSLSLDPKFVNPAGADGILGYATGSDGSDDNFHLQSTVGSVKGASSAPAINQSTGLPAFLTGTVSADANQSPAIDRGSPSDLPGAEPAPNGGYINLGWDGGTSLASESFSQFVIVTTPAGGEVLPIGQTLRSARAARIPTAQSTSIYCRALQQS